MKVSEKLCHNCKYGECARELCGFYLERDLINGCKHFEPEKEEETSNESNVVE